MPSFSRNVQRALTCAIAFTAITAASFAATCDRACLLEQGKQFNAAMLTHTPNKLPLAADVQIRENTKAISLADSKWNGVTSIKSEGVYADPILGNVIEHVAAETTPGKIVYIGTRLKLVDKKITEVEINFDDGPRVVAKNIIPYDPLFETIVPAEQRASREQLEALIKRYFQGLTDHQPVEADYDTRCDRYHSGQRVTHNPRNSVEPGTPAGGGPGNGAPGASAEAAPPAGGQGPARGGPGGPAGGGGGDTGCYESNLGPKPWGPAMELRIAAVDPERGIVIGYSILNYPGQTRKMQINEIFKILDGRIRMVDNIGMMEEGITTSGFTK
jgi:hypothetical protein